MTADVVGFRTRLVSSRPTALRNRIKKHFPASYWPPKKQKKQKKNNNKKWIFPGPNTSTRIWRGLGGGIMSFIDNSIAPNETNQKPFCTRAFYAFFKIRIPQKETGVIDSVKKKQTNKQKKTLIEIDSWISGRHQKEEKRKRKEKVSQ